MTGAQLLPIGNAILGRFGGLQVDSQQFRTRHGVHGLKSALLPVLPITSA